MGKGELMLDNVLTKIGHILTKGQMSAIYLGASIKDIDNNKSDEEDGMLRMSTIYQYLEDLITVMSKKEEYEICDELQTTIETIKLEIFQEQIKK